MVGWVIIFSQQPMARQTSPQENDVHTKWGGGRNTLVDNFWPISGIVTQQESFSYTKSMTVYV